jgi:hypothetical protein
LLSLLGAVGISSFPQLSGDPLVFVTAKPDES